MNLAIYSNQSIETLEKIVHEIFSSVPNFNAIRPKYTEQPFTRELLGKFWKMVPVKDQDHLEIIWFLDNTREYYKSSPLEYFSWLFGHEGENSLTSLLIEEGFALGMNSTYSLQMDLFTKFEISIQLTKKGLQFYNEILKIVFNYLKMLKEKGIDKRIFDEIKQAKSIKFNFLDKIPPNAYVRRLAHQMQYYPHEDILRLNYLMEEFQPDVLQKFVNSLTLENMKIFLISKTLESECDQVESIFQTKYSNAPFTQEIIDSYHNFGVVNLKSKKILDLPPTNIFIPKNFDILNTNTEKLPKYPSKIYESEHTSLWFKQDDTFKVPKASINIKLYSNE